MLVDNVEIKVKAGNGGRGLASFRKEKFLPFGGPDGGDGGKGGDVYLEASNDLVDLASFKHKLNYSAGNGGVGGKNKMHGLNAPDLIIKVPVGTIAYVKDGGEMVQEIDFRIFGQRVKVARGGKGGRGNVHFATATYKAPRDFQPGEKGEQFDIHLDMYLPLDVGIVGMPNSGKSALLSAISGARPQVAEYDFTTLEPVLGAVDDGKGKIIWAEMPAIIESSSSGKGLGCRFLKHLSRAHVLVFLLDATSPHLAADLACLRREIENFNPDLAALKYLVAVNKIDLADSHEEVDRLASRLASDGIQVLPVSAVNGTGLKELVESVHKMVTEDVLSQPQEPEIIFRPRPVDRRD